MTYLEWMSAIGAKSVVSSPQLDALNAALRNYTASTTTLNLMELKSKLGECLDAKPTWAESMRGHGGALDRLESFVSEKVRRTNSSIVFAAAALAAANRTAKQTLDTRHVTKTVYQVQRRPPSTDTSEINWKVRMDLVGRGSAVEAIVHVKPVISDQTLLDDVQQFWKLHVERAWNVATILDGKSRFDLRFRLNFTSSITDAYTVNVENPPPDADTFVRARPHLHPRNARSVHASVNTRNMANWARTDSRAVVHEFGHMIGCPDEYWVTEHRGFGHVFDGGTYNQEPQTMPSVMNNTGGTGGRVFDRHFLFLRNAYTEWRRPTNRVEIKILRDIGVNDGVSV
jgi:hypothetical protein